MGSQAAQRQRDCGRFRISGATLPVAGPNGVLWREDPAVGHHPLVSSTDSKADTSFPIVLVSDQALSSTMVDHSVSAECKFTFRQLNSVQGRVNTDRHLEAVGDIAS